MSGQHCFELNRSSSAMPATLEELLQGNSERGKLYRAVLKKLKEKTVFVSGSHQRRALPAATLTPGQSHGRRSQPYSRPVMKAPHLTPLSCSQPSTRYNQHPYSSNSAVVPSNFNPCTTVSSRTAQPARSVPSAYSTPPPPSAYSAPPPPSTYSAPPPPSTYSTPPPLIQNRVDVMQSGPHTSATAATLPPQPDKATPMDTPTVTSARGRPQPAAAKKGSSLKQSQLIVTNDGAVKLKQSSTSTSSSSLNACHGQKELPSHISQCPQADGPGGAHPQPAPPSLPPALYTLKDISKISTNALSALEDQLQCAQEVGMTLLFSDGSSQLRQGQSSGRGSGGEMEVEGVCLALPVPAHTSGSAHTGAHRTTAVTVEFFLLPLDSRRPRVNQWTRQQLLKLLKSRSTQKICYGAQELMSTVIEHYSLSIPEFAGWYMFDPAIAAWLLDSEHPVKSFCSLVATHGMTLDAGSGNAHSRVCRDLLQLGPTALALYKKMQEHGLWILFSCVEMPLVPLLAGMEAEGISVDTKVLLRCSSAVGQRIKEVEEAAHKAAGRPFLLTSAQQLRQILYEELHLDQCCTKPLMRTAVQRHKSTSEAVLQQLKGLHPLPSLVLEHRQLLKLKSTYIDGVVPFVKNGLLKPNWLHMGTATGRLASTSPNIQAFPKQQVDLAVKQEPPTDSPTATTTTITHINIREAVHSREGFTFVSADFKSIELCLLAHLSGDADLLRVLSASPHSDIFTQLTAEWLSKEEGDVTLAERERTKRVVYAIVYGAGRERLAEILDLSTAAVKEVMDGFLSKFSGVQKFIQSTLTHCRANGYVTSLLGRKRFLPSICSLNYLERSHCERQAVNFVVQGSAADLCKCSMVTLAELLSTECPTAKLVVQIHDELVLEVPDEVAEQVARKVQVMLEGCSLLQSLSQPLMVPIRVKVSMGTSWNALHLMTC